MSTTQNKELDYEKGVWRELDVGPQQECLSLNMGDVEVIIRRGMIQCPEREYGKGRE